MATTRRNLLITTSALTMLATVQAGHAQTVPSGPQPPMRSTIDANGVNVVSGQFVVAAPGISIGEGSNKLAFLPMFNGAYWSNNFDMELYLGAYQATIVSGRHVDQVATPSTNSAYAYSSYFSTKGTGANLQAGGNPAFGGVGVNGYATYRPGDGSQIVFQGPVGGATYNGNLVQKVPVNIVNADGSHIQLIYDTSNLPGYIRLKSVISSYGYHLKLTYASDTLNQIGDAPAWNRLIKAQIVNQAVDYCDPTASSCANLTRSWPTLTYTYSPFFTTMTITDSLGFNTTYALDITKRPTAVNLPSSTSSNVAISYDGNNRVSSLTRNGINYAYSFVQAGTTLTSTLTGPDGVLATTTADTATGALLSSADALNNQTSYQEDGYGRITQVTYPEGNMDQYSYDSNGNLLQQISVPKANGPANITKTAGYPTGCFTSISSICHKPIWTKDALGNETDYTYDSNSGMVTSVTLPADISGKRPQTRYSYNSFMAYYKGSSGAFLPDNQQTLPAAIYYGPYLTGSQYNLPTILPTASSTCRTSSGASLSGSASAGFSLSGVASCVGTSDEVRSTVNYGQQTVGVANNLHPVSQASAAGDNSIIATTSQTFDAVGNVTTVTGPLGSSQTSANMYDANRRLVGIVGPDPDGAGPRTPAATKYSYNADGVLTITQVGTVTDQSANAWNNFSENYRSTTTVDTYDRPIRQTVTSGSATYAARDQLYDAMGRPYCSIQYMSLAAIPVQATSCTPSQTTGSGGPDRVTQTAYDADSRAVSVTEGVGTGVAAVMFSQGYNNNSTVSYIVDGKNNRSSYTYDGFDRLIQTTYPSLTQGANASNSGDYEQFTYDGNSNVAQRRLRDGSTLAFAYDALGRVVSRTPGGTLSYPYDYPVTYSYNLQGQVTQITRSGDGNTLTYGYGALGRLATVGQAFGSLSYQYDAAGNRTRMTWPDGMYVTYSYDYANLPLTIAENGATSGVGVLAAFTYDNLGRRTRVAYGNGTARNYAYDAISRLAGVQLAFPNASYNHTIGGVGGVGTAISYNPASQITSIARSNAAYSWGGAINVNRAYTTNGLNQYTASGSVSLGYDSRGNLSTSGTSSYGYSKLNEMISAPGTALYYDPLSRLSEYDASTSTRFYYDGGQIAAEVSNPAGTVLRRYVTMPGSDEAIIWYEGSGTADRRFLQGDERGSVIAVSDSAGNRIGLNSYDEFGIPASGNVGRFGYTGQAWYSEVGLYNYKSRWYSPTLGRFMQTDPVGYGDGLNWYNYAHGDPINGIDPSGTTCAGGGTWDGGNYSGFCSDNPSDFVYASSGQPLSAEDANNVLNGAVIAGIAQAGSSSQNNQNFLDWTPSDGGSTLPDFTGGGAIFPLISTWNSTAPTPSSSSTAPQSKQSSAPSECSQVLNQSGPVAVDFGNGSLFAGIGGSLSVGYFRNLATGSNGFFATPGGGLGLQAGVGMQGGIYSSMKNFQGFSWSASAAVPSVSGSANFAADGTPVGITAGPGAKAGGSFSAGYTSLFMCNYYGK